MNDELLAYTPGEHGVMNLDPDGCWFSREDVEALLRELQELRRDRDLCDTVADEQDLQNL